MASIGTTIFPVASVTRASATDHADPEKLHGKIRSSAAKPRLRRLLLIFDA
jgi:hypothetical protein